MVSHEEVRRERLCYIQLLLDKPKYKDKEKLIAHCAMKWGASRRTLLEYIKTVELC